MRLLEHFDGAYFQRYLGKSIPKSQNEGASTRRLHLWIPPNPGDAGVPIGAAYAFALQNGASLGKPLTHAFYCGESPQLADIERAVSQKTRVKKLDIGHVNRSEGLHQVADLLAYLVANHGVIGLVQGAAETGPRALGHRSILANPCHPETLAHINARVKHRERIRPLAPMATLPAAMEYFELNPGASDADYSAYHFMVQTVRAKAAAYLKIPAVIHHDGTSRLQIVSQKTDPFTFAFLQRMGHYLGVEIAVNTSLNVGSPMVQTPEQAIEALCKSRGLDGVLFVATCGAVTMVFDTSREGQKDGGQRLLSLLERWQALRPNKSDWTLGN
jgi:carbamoyltransferase